MKPLKITPFFEKDNQMAENNFWERYVVDGLQRQEKRYPLRFFLEGFQLIRYTPEKRTAKAPENQWLVQMKFPFEMVPFLGTCQFSMEKGGGVIEIFSLWVFEAEVGYEKRYTQIWIHTFLEPVVVDFEEVLWFSNNMEILKIYPLVN